MKKLFKINLLNILLLVYLESVFGLLLFNTFNKETIISLGIYILLFSSLITIITTTFNNKTNKLIRYVIYFILCFLFSFQFVFKSSMKTFFTFSLAGIGDQAFDFLGEMLFMIFSNLIGIVILFIPFILLIIFRKKINFNIDKKKYLCIYILIIPILMLSYSSYIKYKDNDKISMYDLYHNINNISLSIQRLGLLPSTFIDIYRTIFGFEEKLMTFEYETNDEETIFNYENNTLELDIDEETPDIIKGYIESNPGTTKNEYTGIFKDKNLIFIVAEGFSTIGIDEKLTPTLYKLTNSGFIFNNYYVPYYLSTIGGEFSALTGIYPDTSTLSIWRSGTNKFPYGISNSFKENGYNTYAYHNYSGYFQDRNKYLEALGFDNFKACSMGLNINCDLWPPSDIELIEASYNDYMNDEKFMTYYMTVSGHLEYNFFGNDMAEKNKDLVEDLPYSYASKAYKATQIELDRALELLIKKLEEQGILDDTVIVMTADHYPYGLDLDEINELSNYTRDELFEINHNSLVIWNNKLNNIEINKVGMPIDVLPTVYNLFGIDYDSRLFTGNDLLSNTEGLVILGNRSWITDKGRFDSTTNTYTGNGDDKYVNYINNLVSNKIAFSKSIIADNGYKHIKAQLQR